jgi:Leucine-rich repeat (LRR) protein
MSLFLLLLLGLHLTTTTTTLFLPQIQALELLYNATQGDHWRWKNQVLYGPKWSFTSPQADPCNDKNRVWQGITCSCKLQSCEILSLNLDGYNLNGTLPSEFFSPMFSLTLLKISVSHNLVGAIPFQIGALSQLEKLYLFSNQLTGSIPSEIGSLCRLAVLSMSNNQFTGTIADEIALLSQLSSLSLDNNTFIGAIPSEIASLSLLSLLSLSKNQLTGTIPSEMGRLSGLLSLYLDNNTLTGTIPSAMGCLSQLEILYLNNNQFNGTITPEIGSLSQLEILYLYDNQLTGTIPSEIGSLSQLGLLYLYDNQLTGTIPSEIGSLSELETLYLDNNQLTGSIPSSFSKLFKLIWLHAYDNRLSGQITFPLASLPKLQQLFLHRNHFTGHLNQLFSWNASSSELLNLDVSDNLFSGSIPSTLFLPHLQSISLSLNCFEHELPSSICEVRDASVISMDGLGSAKGCKNVVTVPFTSVSLVRSLDGNIPDCVWSMSKLKMLNLAGNGLKGRIGATASMSSLLSLTLSHNYLSGEIPLWLQTKNLSHLDLSHNKLTGDANGFRHQNDLDSSNSWNSDLALGSQYLNRSLALTVNRLSGDLPDSFGKYADLDILSGNLFGCGNLPKNDENSDSVSCGSEEYDQTLQLMGGVLGSIVCGVVLLYLLRLLIPSLISRDEKNSNDPKKFPLYSAACYLNYTSDHSILSTSPHSIGNITPSSTTFPSTISFRKLLYRLMLSVCVLSVLCLLFTLPIYVLKQWDGESGDEGDPQYVTHSHMYNWLWTMAFVSGATPAIIFLLMCLVTLSSFTFVTNRLGSVSNLSEESPLYSPTSKTKTTYDHDHLQILTVWTIFIFNVVVVGTVNGLYLWSTLIDLASDVRIWIQFSFGLFSFLWNVVLRRGLSSKIKESRSGVWLFTCLNVMNSVIIPCIVTTLSSPSCYQVRHSSVTHSFFDAIIRDCWSLQMTFLPLTPINLVMPLVERSVSITLQRSWMCWRSPRPSSTVINADPLC